tara:strand:+ start:56 stop:346 length:291 start_codon:yes stop_codon:yes gene_type:complete
VRRRCGLVLQEEETRLCVVGLQEACDALQKEGAEAACAEACCSCDEDESSWFFKKAKRDCAWVAKKAKSRCKKKGRDGDGKKKKAKVACPVACCGR